MVNKKEFKGDYFKDDLFVTVGSKNLIIRAVVDGAGDKWVVPLDDLNLKILED